MSKEPCSPREQPTAVNAFARVVTGEQPATQSLKHVKAPYKVSAILITLLLGIYVLSPVMIYASEDWAEDSNP